MSETNSISSSGTGTVEYKVIKQLTHELRIAVKDDLQYISDQLLSCGMITEDSHEEFTCTNYGKPPYARAASLVHAVLNQIKLDSGYYYDFIQVLEENKEYYNSILQNIQNVYTCLDDVSLQERPLSSKSQHHCNEESQSEEDESNDLVRKSQVQCEGETSPKPEQGKVKSTGPYHPSSVCGCVWAIIKFCCLTGIIINILCLAIRGIMYLIFSPLRFCHDKTTPYVSSFCLIMTIVSIIFLCSIRYICQPILVRSFHTYNVIF